LCRLSLPDASRPAYLLSAEASRLTEFLEEKRKEGYVPAGLSAVALDNELRFTALMLPRKVKGVWEAHIDLRTEDVKSKSASLADKGFRPASITAYPWDGAVRYCVVWVKDPPRPVPSPKQAMTITQPGWETLIDASKSEMEKWLADRKKAKHSVLWLDAVKLGDQPVFTAIAALDDRQPDWKAFLDTPADDFGNGNMLNNITPKTDNPLAVSGYMDKGTVLTVSLWRKGFVQFFMDPEMSLNGLPKRLEEFRPDGGVIRLLRPYAIGEVDTRAGFLVHRAIGQKADYLVDVGEESLNDFVKARQEAGDRITSLVVAYPKDDRLLFAVVGATNPEKLAWKLEHGLTADRFKARNTELATEGYHPSTITVCPWDGSVRYAVVWVKDAAKK
jgi:hypothetical protein